MLDIDKLIESEGLFVTTLPDGRSFTWRLLTLKEYRVFRGLRESRVLAPMVVHDRVFDRCYLGNTDLIDGETPAGYCISVGELIMWLSGDSAGHSDRDDIELARMAYPADTVNEFMKRIVLRAFPSYKIEDVETWSRPTLLQRFVMAECLLAENGSGYQPLELKNIVSAEQRAKAARKAQGIDFAGENARLDQAMGGKAGGDILDLPPDQFQKKMKIAKRMEERRARARGE
jgi:hypothetical protein